MVAGPVAPVRARGGAAGRVWWRSLRAYSFAATLAPVGCAFLLAGRGSVEARLSPAACALMTLAALLLHAAANVLNDYYDFILGFDTPAAAGSSGLLLRGEVEPDWMRAWGRRYLAAAAIVGLPLAAMRGPLLLAMGAAGWTGALLYSHCRGYKYRGWGEPLVFLLMGPLLFCSAWLAAVGWLPWRALWLSLPFGCLVTSILLVNNLRDLEMDRAAGFRTLPARIGPAAAKALFILLVGAAMGLPALYVGLRLLPASSLLVLIAGIPLAGVVRDVWRAAPPYARLAVAPQRVASAYLLFGLLMAAVTIVP